MQILASRLRRVSPRRSAAWVLIGLLGACLLGPGGCDRPATQATSSDAPAAQPAALPPAGADSQKSPAAPGSGPVMTFARLSHDFGPITDTRTYDASFSFTNTGDQTLQIAQMKASCGCTVPTLSKRAYQPGESGELKVVYDPAGKSGAKPKTVTIISNAANADANGLINLTLLSTVKPMVRPDSRFMQFRTIAMHQEHRRVMNMVYTDPDLEFVDATVNHDHISAKVIESGVMQSSGTEVLYRAAVEVVVHADAPWGSLYQTRLTTKVRGRPSPEADPIEYEYVTYLQGNIFGQIKATSTSRGRGATPGATVSLGGTLTSNTPFEQTVTLTRDGGEPFQIIEHRIADTTMPGLQVRVEVVDPATHRVLVFGNTGDFRGDVRGRIELTTDVPGEELLTVRFAGRVR